MNKNKHSNGWPTEREFEESHDSRIVPTGKHRKLDLIEVIPGLMPDPDSNNVRELVMPL